MLEQLTYFIIHFIQSSGYLGIFSLMLLGSALIPIPSEVILPFAGFLTSKGVFLFTFVVAIAATGDLAGSWILYGIGYALEEKVILKLIRKHGKYVLLTEDDYTKAEKWFKHYGNGIVFIAKLIPGLRYLISLPAGVLKMNLAKFSLYTFIGSLVWCTAMVYFGLYLGDKWSSVGPYFTKFRDGILIFLVLLAALYINHRLKLISFRKKNK